MVATIKIKNLAAATTASVKAALGKEIPKKPGTLAGFILKDRELAKLDVSAASHAKTVAKDVSLASGIKLTPGTQRIPGGVLVGYRVPAILK
jgi:hypothetical protein